MPYMSTGSKTSRKRQRSSSPPPPPYDITIPSHLLWPHWQLNPLASLDETETLKREFITFISTCSHSFVHDEPPVSVRWSTTNGGRTFTTFSPLSDEAVLIITNKRLLEFSYHASASAAAELEYHLVKNVCLASTRMTTGAQELQIRHCQDLRLFPA